MDTLTRIEQLPQPPSRPEDAHKGTFGTVIVVGGCETMIGAPALCARAALRGGAGLVKIATLPAVLPHALTIEPGATGIVLKGDVTDWQQAIDAADPEGKAVLAVGPGMGLEAGGEQKVLSLLNSKRLVVLDADGLNLLARTGQIGPGSGSDQHERVLTPHPGEFARLAEPLGITEDPTDKATRPSAAAKLALAYQGTVLLKGAHTVVTDGKSLYVNQTGNPALATAGSGDVLTGLIASLIAQGMPAFDATCLGAHLHGLAADHWSTHHGPHGLRAQDLADHLPDAIGHHSHS